MEHLQARDLYSFYGKSPVIQGVSFDLGAGEFLAVLGRNGVGKTTLLKSVMGLTDRCEGGLAFGDTDILSYATPLRARLGIGYIPQGREIIPQFTVRENILMGTFARTDGKRDIPEYLFEMFPILDEFINRRGGDLSGGQQQQLAIARALAMDPKILILDEPTEGIQPNIVKQIEEAIVRLNRERGLGIILVEQNVTFARAASDRFIVLDKGRVVLDGKSDDLTEEAVEKHLTF
ncbi:High-affinity branched-chain amino acid transport ATP-binding protein LivF [Roseovarius sp. THAF27]|uniref:urea ABC transporter ATP-binding subunit UrtE n=1 Tax=unclassified Roseovarius TaxID=2614913 RepID=UPI001268E4B2|nr:MULTISPECIES: urea ABC transporter ATP-binding subunit UrtE [unclassified Roseovarius]QFT82362.1 High-affinity branched-chain amino acid transport ATP-binding protein LivF [Roseovarius sp. THAF27]QFT98605.1 High-affinity branched-chain amino acid transport ATP-binding protein LivF [Roseovarius sp. THAF8]